MNFPILATSGFTEGIILDCVPLTDLGAPDSRLSQSAQGHHFRDD